MDVKPFYTNATAKTRYYLVFFCFCLLMGCTDTEITPPELQYDDTRAVSVTFSPEDRTGPFKVYLAGEDSYPVLGNMVMDDGSYTFIPAVPFSQGNSYVIRQGDMHVAEFSIPEAAEGAIAPEVVALYPDSDTIPENLLKCYIQFSEPMQAVGKALDYITVYRQTGGSEVEIPVFLVMEAELWSKDHSQLTLWIDPGRVKTGLIPNEKNGRPLDTGSSYRIKISRTWESARGIPLLRDFQKLYYVGPADRKKPDPALWEFRLPKAQTQRPLEILFRESVDLVLAREAFLPVTEEGIEVGGKWIIRANKNSIAFEAKEPWVSGNYKLLVDPRLEDLAGNNLTRLFETDLKAQTAPVDANYQLSLPFQVNY